MHWNNWLSRCPVNPSGQAGRRIRLVMAGNIPLVGFHDFLSVFCPGHSLCYKLHRGMEVLIRHLAGKLVGMGTQRGTDQNR